MAKKSKSKLIYFLVFTGIMVSLLICTCIGFYTLGRLTDSSLLERTTLTTRALEQRIETPSITVTETPNVIFIENLEEYDGVKFSISDIQREQILNDSQIQHITITLSLQSGNVSWTGFDLKGSELIVESDSGFRGSVESEFPVCLIYNNDSCSRIATYVLPISDSHIKLYYVSDKRMDGKEPIDVTDPDDHFFVAEVYLQNLIIKPPSTATATNIPTSISTPTSALALTPTEQLSQTIEPSPTIEPTVDVLGILGKPVDQVEAILGQTVLITPNDDYDDNLAGGEYRDYEIGKYVVFVAYDSNRIARVFQVLDGLSNEKYSITDWDLILPMFGVYPSSPPEREAPAAVYWDNYKGYFIAVVASSTSGEPVWTVQISEAGYQ